MKHRVLIASIAALSGLSGTVPVYAQTADTSGALETVVVTAERRSENIQNIPASVTAITGDQLTATGIVNTQDLTLAVPGLNVARSTIATLPTIRGIGGRSASTGNEGNVAIYVDGVYQAQPFANLFDLDDIQRVEVLKGPQGTLYGRNATGGAINIITRTPSFDTQANVAVSYGTFNERGVQGYITGPIIDGTLAGSLSINASKDDGYIDNLWLKKRQGGNTEFDVHGKLLWQVSDDTKIGLSVLDTFINQPDNNEGFWWKGNSVLNAPGKNPLGYPNSILVPTGPYNTSSPIDAIDDVHSTEVDLNGSSDFGWATLNGVVSFKKDAGNALRDSTASPYFYNLVDIFPWEESWYGNYALTSSNSGPFTWIVGGDGWSDTTKTRPQVLAGNAVSTYGLKTQAFAFYAEGTYELFGQLFLTGGLRWSQEYKSAFNQSLVPLHVPFTGNDSWNALTPHAVVRWQFSENSNLYFSYSEGFKSGSADASGQPFAFADPEKVKAYEVGLKSDLTDALRLNLSGFHYDYTDMQEKVIHTNPNGTTFSSLQNAASSRINGAEAEAEYVVTDNIHLNANLEYLDAHFVSFPNAIVNVPKFCSGVPCGNLSVTQNLAGYTLNNAPSWTYTLGADFNTKLAQGLLLGNLSYFHSSKFFTDPNDRLFQPDYGILNASISWTTPDGHTKFALTGRNLTDEKVVTEIFESGNGDFATYQRPRTILLTIGYAL